MQRIYSERKKIENEAKGRRISEEIKAVTKKVFIPIKAPATGQVYNYDGKVFTFVKNPRELIPQLQQFIDNPNIKSIVSECDPDPLFRSCLRVPLEVRVACFGYYDHKPDYPENGKGNWVRLEHPKFYNFSYDRKLKELWHIACNEVGTLKNP